MALEVGVRGEFVVCRACPHTDDDEPDVWTDINGDTYFEGETVASLRAFLDRHDQASAQTQMASNIQPMPDPYEEARKARHARRDERYNLCIVCGCGALIYSSIKSAAETEFRLHQQEAQ